ncbi:hypothetical protein GUITHDRAFT_145616 [Guillardia theta CCMP2712]|uniref:Uncharacterized protein n=1 Tax=Guillardia theta (strain CCMP2712) TaxID=905079 RepID=L1IL86_GUITC|nr:hypothetical protein GUITHDRAFT_145616 [Guillardia theta CCMP2712]EKX36664.1 hypothetical protein GUITHDRAFT_145616 [Guillardia theta CCMP2712]|eukprot:XP_005823644.1 hypothetical protein GUITHDRAFT_145616 [Guillardia theta CCMP2712]
MTKQHVFAWTFMAEHLHVAGLLTSTAAPNDLASIVAGLYHLEPANFAVGSILFSGLFEAICEGRQHSSEGVQEDLVAIFCYLISVLEFPRWKAEYLSEMSPKKKQGKAEGEQAFLLDLSSNVILRSRFVAMAGRGDSLEDVATSISSYVYDLWKDPQDVSRTTREIGNRTSHGLKHFALSMKAIVASLDGPELRNHLQLDLCSKFGAIFSNMQTQSSDD